MRTKLIVTTVALLQLFYLVCSMQTFDMCATFQKTFTDKSLTLVTPGYLDNTNYPNNSRCECSIDSLSAAGEDKSLNVTVQHLDMETTECPSNPYDTLVITAVYSFEVYFREFTLCGSTRPISHLVALRGSGDPYGSQDTIYSMDMLRVAFNSDDDIESLGSELLIESYSGLVVKCVGTSGPLPTAAPPTVPTTTAAKTTPYDNSVQKKRKREKEGNQSVTIGAVIGVFAVIFAVGLGVLVFVLIRKHKKNEPYRLKPRGGAAIGGETRRSSEGRPIYRDPCEGHPDLPMPSSVRMQCTDEYLYMPNDPTTPVYAEPQPMIYANQDMGVAMAQEEQYKDGYIIPGSLLNSEGGAEGAPLVRQIPKTPNKPPMPQPKSGKPLMPPILKHQPANQAPVNSNQSTARSSPSDSQNSAGGAACSEPTNEMVYAPALLKPSDMKNKNKFFPQNKPNVTFGESSGKPAKPAIKAKPNLKKQMAVPPPKPPAKSASLTSDSGDTYQVVDVQTT